MKNKLIAFLVAATMTATGTSHASADTATTCNARMGNGGAGVYAHSLAKYDSIVVRLNGEKVGRLTSAGQEKWASFEEDAQRDVTIAGYSFRSGTLLCSATWKYASPG